MIRIVEAENLNYLFLYTSPDHFKRLKDRLSARVQNYYFMPSYKNGSWDGKIYFLYNNGKFFRGLVWEVLKYASEWKIPVEFGINVIYRNLPDSFKLNLKTELWERQKEAYDKIRKFNFGLVKMPTGSGKTLVELAIVDEFFHTETGKIAIIVPRTSLVEQFYDRFQQFAPDDMKDHVGRFYGGKKEIDKRIVVFTWQSLLSLKRSKSKKKILDDFKVLIFDEVHFSKAKEIKSIVTSFTQAKYRYGFTATLPQKDKASLMMIKALFGEVMYEYKLAEAIEEKTLSTMEIQPIVLEYDYPRGLTYQEDEEFIAKQDFRYEILKSVVDNYKDRNVLILVRFVEVAKRIAKELGVHLFYGATAMDERKEVLNIFEKNKGVTLVATLGVFGVGIDVKNVDVLILFQPRKSEIELLQAIGRGLRKRKGKHLLVFDFVDAIPYFSSYFKERLRTYKREGVKVLKQKVYENNNII